MPQLVLCEICCDLSLLHIDNPLLDQSGKHSLDLEVLLCWEYFVGSGEVAQLLPMVEWKEMTRVKGAISLFGFPVIQ